MRRQNPITIPGAQPSPRELWLLSPVATEREPAPPPPVCFSYVWQAQGLALSRGHHLSADRHVSPQEFALRGALYYDFSLPPMSESPLLPCDGCGQPATSEHIAKRLERLEWMTRYRPIYITALLLGAVSPDRDGDFLYSPSGEFSGEAGRVLGAAGISQNGKSTEAVLVEFQRRGLLLTHVLGCPIESPQDKDSGALLKARFPATLARIRRSFRPKRVVPISRHLEPLFHGAAGLVDVGCPIVLTGERAFSLDEPSTGETIAALRQVLVGAEVTGRS